MFRRHHTNTTTTSMQFELESLEDRQMLSTFAFVDAGGTLQIQGDDASDRIAIVSDGATITVSGRDINGGNDPVTFDASSVDSLFASLGDGNDRISFESTGSTETQFEHLQIITGEGNDQVTITANNDDSSGIIADLISIQTGNGNDRVTFESNITTASNDFSSLQLGIAAESWFINTGDGNDRFTMTASNSGATFGFAAEDININTAGGSDRILLDAENGGSSAGFAFEEQLVIDSAGGKDRVDLVADNSGNSVGFASLSTEAELLILTGADDDRVSIIASNDGVFGFALAKTLIDTGEGRDRFTMRARNANVGIGFASGETLIQTGGGSDRIDIKAENRGAGSSFDFGEALGIFAGSDNDSVSLNVKNGSQFTAGILDSFRIEGEGGDRDNLKTNFNIEDETSGFAVVDFERITGETGLT